jgi:hypothetical protein
VVAVGPADECVSVCLAVLALGPEYTIEMFEVPRK